MVAQPKEIRKLGNKELKIVWVDGHQSSYSFRSLRQNCRCALCIEEGTGKAILVKDQVALDLEGLKVSTVGQYALRFDFSDGHNTGLYTYQHLREKCKCKNCL